jgi:hypothetical protein
MTAAKTATAPAAEQPPTRDPALENLISISETPGAELDIGLCRWTSNPAATYDLLHYLGALTGRFTRNGDRFERVDPRPYGVVSDERHEGQDRGGVVTRTTFGRVGEPAPWPTLNDVSAAEITAAVARVKGKYASVSWDLDAPVLADIRERLNVHFARAQYRQRKDLEPA